MRRIILLFVLSALPLLAWADGMVMPTVAYPATVSIPDQQAMISFSNGMERLVIETRFTGSGSNFAWVVPLPSQPVIEEATPGLFPTLQYLLRPKIIHEVPRYYIGIGLALLFVYLVSRRWYALFLLLLLLALVMLSMPVLSGASRSIATTTGGESVSILDRKLVGIFEMLTLTARDSRGLENWLRDNQYAVAPDASPVIADYLKNGWVFVAAKVRRDNANFDTSTPHPLSFTFKTANPVYPMRLTGLRSHSLKVNLFVVGDTAETAPHFKVENCRRLDLAHPLLRQWLGPAPVITKLTAALSPADMRKDVWLNQSPFQFQREHQLYSRQGAFTTALNGGAGFFGATVLILCCVSAARESHRPKLVHRVGQAAVLAVMLTALVYLSLPKIEVRLVRGGFRQGYFQTEREMSALQSALDDLNGRTLAEARSQLQKTIANPANAENYRLKGWDNFLAGGPFHEEDSPGNYLLRETNNQLELILIDQRGGELNWQR